MYFECSFGFSLRPLPNNLMYFCSRHGSSTLILFILSWSHVFLCFFKIVLMNRISSKHKTYRKKIVHFPWHNVHQQCTLRYLFQQYYLHFCPLIRNCYHSFRREIVMSRNFCNKICLVFGIFNHPIFQFDV